MQDTSNSEMKLPGIDLDHPFSFEPQHTPDDLDKEIPYAMLRLPTEKELEDYAGDVLERMGNSSEEFHGALLADKFLELFKRMRKEG